MKVRYKRKLWSRKKDKKDIIGISIFDKKEVKYPYNKTGYLGSISIESDGSLMIFTDGNYRYIPKKYVAKLLKKMLKQIENEEK